MRYAEKDNLETLWGADYLADILPEDVDVVSAIEEALDMASAEVDGYLVRYQLPLSSKPRVSGHANSQYRCLFARQSPCGSD